MLNTALFITGILLTFISFIFLKNTLNNELTLRTNYRDKKITCLGGLFFLTSFLMLSLIMFIVNNKDSSVFAISLNTILLVIGFAVLGLIDDLIGNKDSQGFKGHILTIFKGKLSTGGLKLFGGPLICFIALYPSVQSLGYKTIIVDVVAISLIANLVNLFDLAPGRSLKISILSVVICVSIVSQYEWQYGVLGILLVLLYLDLKEYMMIGDIGSNMIGALVGFNIVNIATLNQTYIIVAVAFALNLLSEFISFSKIINSFLPLRLLDTLGQTKERKQWLKDKSIKS